jgi:methylthioribulose-1-phosphate dehydratase
VQKERIQPEDMFVYSIDGQEKNAPPPSKGYKASQCTPLFFAAYKQCGAGAVIHTHSQHAVRATLLAPGNEFQITHQEMIKGIRQSCHGERLRYFDTLTVPIIENTTHESDLTESLEQAIASNHKKRSLFCVDKLKQSIPMRVPSWFVATEFMCGAAIGSRPKQ